MFEQLFENLRRASEASLLGQQQLFKQWLQQWPTPLQASGSVEEWRVSLQKHWTDSLSDTLNRHRELFESTYRAGMQLIDQTLRVSEVKSSEDYKRYVEELWRKLSDTVKDQVEGQLREMHKVAERWPDVSRAKQ